MKLPAVTTNHGADTFLLEPGIYPQSYAGATNSDGTPLTPCKYRGKARRPRLQTPAQMVDDGEPPVKDGDVG